MTIKEVTDKNEKQLITKTILEALPDWFAVEESRMQYIDESVSLPLFAAYDGERPVGFICLKETGKDTVEIHVMGVLKEYHRNGIGKKLFEEAKAAAARKGYSFLQVKTVLMGKYEDYDRTNRFYLSLGFKEFEVFPLFWDEANPCQIYVMACRDTAKNKEA
ncbi:MAG: GNAT family N-acetyltransferase [Treponema sp.]|nr:GNAT family N-acetyltransferase [Treponema sp.]